MSLVRKVFVVLLAVFSVSAGARAETVDKLSKPTAYVSDFANVMDAASIQQMENICGQIERKAHAQIAVVTVNDTGGEDIFQFTQDLQQKWGVGTKPDDRGVLMVFAIHDRKRWINVGKGLEGILNDAKVGDIGRAMVPQLKAEEYGPAALTGVQQIAGVIAADAGVALDAPVRQTYRQQTARQSSGRGFGIGGIIFFLVIAFLIFGRGRGGRGGGGGGGLGWLLLGSMLGGGRGFGGGG
ncbi:MAG: TPM domain-containing protein, partial [Acidobacteriota bacterium]|nr:TPM domain-containing protein [Acidobacteriota bacterium]